MLAVGALVIFGRTFGVSSADISDSSNNAVIHCRIYDLYTISAPMNVLRSVILGGCIVGLLFCSIFLNDLFAGQDDYEVRDAVCICDRAGAAISDPADRKAAILL